MSRTIDQIQTDIIEEFSLLGDWEERYRYLIELGRKLPPFPDILRTDANLVRGCQSRVWVHHHLEDQRLFFTATSEALIVSGLIALLLRVFSGQAPQVISATEPRFVNAIGLADHLSPTRSNGLFAMIKTIKAIAAQASEQGG